VNFYHPWGLLGLIGVPILIIIYIIKNKYTEQVVSSTYLWTLSEKFLKKRLPVSRLVGIISLILQIIAVILISLAVAHPVLVIRNSAHDYCFVLDGSGSMNITEDGTTRHDLAKAEIKAVIDDSMNGSSYTLIFVGATSDVIFENETDREKALNFLENVKPSYTASSVADGASVAQGYLNANPAIVTYLFTDKIVETDEDINVVRVGTASENYSLSSLDYSFINKKLVVSGKALSYKNEAIVNVELYVDEETQPSLTQEVEVLAHDGTMPTGEFVFEAELANFRTFKVVISTADSFALDNEQVVYNYEYEAPRKTLIVSDNPFFIQAAFVASTDIRPYVIAPENYQNQTGYDLYIFDSFSPRTGWTLPEDGAVWFFNPTSGITKTGFSVQNEITSVASVTKDDYSNSTKTLAKTLLKDVKRSEFSVAKYKQCRPYRTFTDLLSFNGSPLVFAGFNDFGNREVVFAFDLHDSDFPLVSAYMSLFSNLISYTFPTALGQTSYTCGETVNISAIAGCDSVRVVSPSGSIRYLDASQAVCELDITEVGTYTVTLIMKDKSSQVLNFYSAVPEEECNTAAAADSFTLSGEREDSKRDGIFDNLLILFILFALLFAADWAVYCYEQYQLR